MLTGYASPGKAYTLNTHTPRPSRLAALIDASRTALFGGLPTLPVEARAEAQVDSPPISTPEGPSWALQRLPGPVSPRVAPAPLTFPSAEALAEGLDLSRGAARVLDVLHDLARQRARVLGLEAVPSSLVVFCPAVLVYALAGYSESHGDRLARELRAAGALDFRGWVADVGKLRRYAGTLWCVRLRLDAPRPRLRWWDYRHDWRPDFDQDYHGEAGAFRAVQDAMGKPVTPEGRIGRLRELALTFAEGSYRAKPPTGEVPSSGAALTLRGVAERLPALTAMYPAQRHREVGHLAAEIAHVLGEPGRYRQWCREVYRALRAEAELRPGLQPLAAALCRLAADLAEGAPWKRPGSVLQARLNPSL